MTDAVAYVKSNWGQHMCSYININLFSSPEFLVNGFHAAANLQKEKKKKKDNEINLPAICCALTVLLGLQQHLIHPWAAKWTLCTSQYPNLIKHPKDNSITWKSNFRRTGIICCMFSSNALKKRTRRRKSQKLFSRHFSTLWKLRSHKEADNSFRYLFPQTQPRFFCLILRGSQMTSSHQRRVWFNSLQVHRQRRTSSR